MTGKHDKIVKKYHQRILDSDRRWEVYPFHEYEWRNRGKLCQGEIDLYAVDYVNGKPYIALFEIKTNDKVRAREKTMNQLGRADSYLRSQYGSDARIFHLYAHSKGIERISLDTINGKDTSELEKKINSSEHLQKFQDQFTPAKLRAYLHCELQLDKNGIDYYSKLYEDTIYKPVIKAYKGGKE